MEEYSGSAAVGQTQTCLQPPHPDPDTKTKQCGLAHKREVRGEEEQLQL